MKTLRASIEFFFRQIDIEKKIQEKYSGAQIVHRRAKRLIESVLDDQLNPNRSHNVIDGYSMDDSKQMFQKVEEDWAKSDRSEGRKSHVLGLVYRYCVYVLTLEHNEPTVQFSEMLRWRELSHLLGEDLFTTLFVAYEDLRYRHQRNYFDWASVISTNNLRLKNLLRKGIAENHFHLNGSAPHCDLSWINLMNNIVGRSAEFRKFKLEQERDENYAVKSDLELLVWKAAYIRCMLFDKIKSLDSEKEDPCFPNYSSNRRCCEENVPKDFSGKTSKEEENEDDIFSIEDEERWMTSDKNEVRSILTTLQRKIDTFKMLYGNRCTIANVSDIPDYCFGKEIKTKNGEANELLTGERWFLYRCFRMVAAEKKEFAPYEDLLYLYLLIKQKFRDEVIQLNKQVGFANFSSYQDRKAVFLWENKLYWNAVRSMAVSSSLLNQHINSLEARITPRKSSTEMCNEISELDRVCLDKYEGVDHFMARHQLDDDLWLKDRDASPLFYNIHFIKKEDEQLKNPLYKKIEHITVCRHDQLRKSLKEQAIALLRSKWSTREEGRRIQGIDAASSEFVARPEVFAQAYRYLKFCRSSYNYDDLLDSLPQKLAATFHAGEDFYDIADGLRAIDESIRFLNLDNGDRIGHALALGIDAKAYYQKKHHVIMMPKHWVLDNYAWLISRIHKYDLSEFSAFCGSLEREFDVLFQDLYGDFLNERGKWGDESSDEYNDYVDVIDHEPFHMTHITPTLYFEAWKLRGDDPYLYTTTGFFQRNKMKTLWDEAGENCKYPTGGLKRKSRLVCALYHAYHFDYKVRSKGDKVKRLDVSDRYIQLIEAIQKAMQKEIASRHIAIECNPSSNFLIGTFRRYDKHPIMNFFNMGLTYDPKQLDDCAQLCVSINTDDQGVFNTTLENEYAIMARALEKMKDERGKHIYKPAQIYQWLEHIRVMGIEMSFRNHNNN